MSPRSSSLALIRQLCAELSKRDVLWCEPTGQAVPGWFTNGSSDLDVLVRSADTERFSEAVQGLDFKRAFPVAATGAGTSQSPLFWNCGGEGGLVSLTTWGDARLTSPISVGYGRSVSRQPTLDRSAPLLGERHAR